MLISEIPKSNVVVGDISKTIGYATAIIVFNSFVSFCETCSLAFSLSFMLLKRKSRQVTDREWEKKTNRSSLTRCIRGSRFITESERSKKAKENICGTSVWFLSTDLASRKRAPTREFSTGKLLLYFIAKSNLSAKYKDQKAWVHLVIDEITDGQ